MNNSFNSQNRFIQFEKAHYFTRVDDGHPLELMIGLNSKGKKSIQLKSHFKPIQLKGTTAIEVNQFVSGAYSIIQFSLTDDDSLSLFYKFCDDIVDSSRSLTNVEKGYDYITSRFSLWKKMFIPKNTIMSESQIQGLIGELFFLKDFAIPKYGAVEGLKGWTGAEKTHKDFSYEDFWYEVKSINTSASSVRISSIEQLESNAIGYLIVESFEKMSPASHGINLNSLVIDIRDALPSLDLVDLFLVKIAEYGYRYSEEYSQFVFEYRGTSAFCVDEHFPRIQRKAIDEAITKIAYELSLNSIIGKAIDIE